MPFIRPLKSPYSGNSQQENHETIDIASSSIASNLAARTSTQPTSVAGEHSQDSPNKEADREACRDECPELSDPSQLTCPSDSDANDSSIADSIGEEAPNMQQATQTPQARQQVQSSNRRKLKKKLRRKTLEAQVLAFRAWEKPHRTDEHITPGVYRGFWKWLARCLTFYIPSWFLKNYLKMDDLRQRLAFRQKVLFCLLLAAIYALICYFLIIQP